MKKTLIKAIAGSHLFGTNTPESDHDYKGVYLPDCDSILLGNYSEAIHHTTGNDVSRNSKEDVDIELYSLKKFFKMVKHGDTAALELMFTPEEMILEKDPLWDEFIIANRDKLINSKITAMIGYARQQANKYGIKGSRMGELNNIIEFLSQLEKGFDFPNPKLKLAWGQIQKEVEKYEHVHLTMIGKNEEFPAVDILGKKFDEHASFPYVLSILKKIYKNYGQRAREAKKNNGIDWKALSHAVRVMYQGLELLETGYITLPLKFEYLTTVRLIKAGHKDYSDVQELIENLMERLEVAKKNSNLPEKVDQELIDELIIEMHLQQIKEIM